VICRRGSLRFADKDAGALLWTKKKIKVLIQTRLQPGDREYQEKGGNRFKRFPSLSLAQFHLAKARCE